MLTKAPGERLDYGLDWRAKGYLEVDENISASVWTVPTGLTSTSDTFDENSTTIWITGGTADDSYALVNTITTSKGRIAVRTLNIAVRSR